MLLASNHLCVEMLIASFFLGAVLTSPGALVAQPETSTFANNLMGDRIGLKRSREKEAAFVKALDDHQGILMKICRLYCNRLDEEKDLFQEIVFQLWKAYPSFRSESEISTWMYSIALKTAMVPYRRGKLKVEYGDVHPDIAQVDANEPDLDSVHEVIRKLNPVNRAIVVLMMEGYSRKEVAATVGISEEAVTMRMTRLRNNM